MTTLATRSVPAWRLALWAAAALLLLTPLVAMRFTGEVNWTGFDFAIAAVLLGGAAGAIELAVRVVTTPARRIVAVGAILVALVLVWLQGAVGLI